MWHRYHETEARSGRAGGGLLGGLLLGAGLMYVLDPAGGRRRRALFRQKINRSIHRTQDVAGATARDLSHRMHGVLAELRGRRRPDGADDQILAERVRAKMGRYVSHPHAIKVHVEDGCAILSGPILAREVDGLVHAVALVRGIHDVESRLEVHETPEGVPALQGEGRTRPVLSARDQWPPALRLAGAVGGGVLVTAGLLRRDGLGLAAAGLGALTAARALTNLPARRLFGAGAGRRAIEVHKSVELLAPIREVFEFWKNFENFPRFMEHVREVRVAGDGRSRWVVDGPAGVPVEWDALVTRIVPDQLVAWKSAEGSAVQSEGIVTFHDLGDGRTRVDIHLAYNPPGGAIGHAFARLFQRDPKHQIAEDLVRLKSLFEQGVTRAHGHRVTRDDVFRH